MAKCAIIRTELELIHMSPKKILIATLIAAAVGAWVGNYNSVQKALKLEAAETLAWCDRIYHQNVGCPDHGKVEIPASVLAEEEAEHLKWCDRIYHENVGCPKHGQVEIPASVLAEEKAKHLKWCNRIYHQNAGCPQKGMQVPLLVRASQEKSRLEWCDRISHRNVSCPLHSISPLVSFIKGEITVW